MRSEALLCLLDNQIEQRNRMAILVAIYQQSGSPRRPLCAAYLLPVMGAWLRPDSSPNALYYQVCDGCITLNSSRLQNANCIHQSHHKAETALISRTTEAIFNSLKAFSSPGTSTVSKAAACHPAKGTIFGATNRLPNTATPNEDLK